MATLLRKSLFDNCLYAEESFYVQFKSQGTEPIIYQNHEVSWLQELQLPFFIGMVDKKSSKLDLYPTHKLCDVFIGLNKFNKVTVRPESKGNEAGLIEDQSIEIFLGPPLLSFGMDRVSDAEFSQRAYHLLKKYLQLEQRNVNARHTRFVNHLSWKTNEVVELAGSANSLSKASQKEDLHNACEAIAPGLSLAKMYAKATNDKALSEAISEVTVRLTKIFTEKEYLNEEKTCYEEWSNPFEYTSL